MTSGVSFKRNFNHEEAFLELQKNWRPSAAIENLKVRAQLLETVRAFFKERHVLEIETPVLCRTATTDPYLRPIPVSYSEFEQSTSQTFYLQTSPEFAMKRLLAAGSGPIYQITKAFRNGEVGRLHNPEFTMLEWYRPGFDHHDLMDEVQALLCIVLGVEKTERLTYETLFLKILGLNPHRASLAELKTCAISRGIQIHEGDVLNFNSDDWLDILMTHCIEPSLGFEYPVMVYDYPASKAALAKIRKGEPSVAERFEVYVNGMELANGYHELTDPEIQFNRFKADCEVRKKLNLSSVPMDNYLLAALEQGLPASAGVALGFDRLVMLKLQSATIEEVVSFTIDRV